MGTSSKKHVHKYMRQQLKHIKVWRCALPDCSHWMPPYLEEMIIGRTSLCWECSEQFTLDEDAIAEDMPRCIKCRQPEIADFSQFIKQQNIKD